MLVSDADILNDVLNADAGDLPPPAATALLNFRFSDKAVARMNELAAKNREGSITPDERDLMDRYVRIGNFLNLVHVKARASLKAGPSLNG